MSITFLPEKQWTGNEYLFAYLIILCVALWSLHNKVNRFVSWEERGNLPYLIFSPKVIIIFTKERLQILSWLTFLSRSIFSSSFWPKLDLNQKYYHNCSVLTNMSHWSSTFWGSTAGLLGEDDEAEAGDAEQQVRICKHRGLKCNCCNLDVAMQVARSHETGVFKPVN